MNKKSHNVTQKLAKVVFIRKNGQFGLKSFDRLLNVAQIAINYPIWSHCLPANLWVQLWAWQKTKCRVSKCFFVAGYSICRRNFNRKMLVFLSFNYHYFLSNDTYYIFITILFFCCGCCCCYRKKHFIVFDIFRIGNSRPLLSYFFLFFNQFTLNKYSQVGTYKLPMTGFKQCS